MTRSSSARGEEDPVVPPRRSLIRAASWRRSTFAPGQARRAAEYAWRNAHDVAAAGPLAVEGAANAAAARADEGVDDEADEADELGGTRRADDAGDAGEAGAAAETGIDVVSQPW